MSYEEPQESPESAEIDQDVIIAQLEESRQSKKTRRSTVGDKKIRERGIVFEQPTTAEQAKSYKDDPTRPLVDRFGRPRWISDRLCWCSTADGAEECRFHNPSEPGWEECPSRPINIAQDNYKVVPRRLWHSNPDFDKPPTEAEREFLLEGGSIATDPIVENEKISYAGDVKQVIEIID